MVSCRSTNIGFVNSHSLLSELSLDELKKEKKLLNIFM